MTSSIIDGIGHWSHLHQNHPRHFLLIWQQNQQINHIFSPTKTSVQFPNYPAVNMTAGLQNTNCRAPAVRFFQENLRHDSNLSWPSNQTIPHNPPPQKNGPAKTHPKFKKNLPYFLDVFLGSLIYLGGSFFWGSGMSHDFASLPWREDMEEASTNVSFSGRPPGVTISTGWPTPPFHGGGFTHPIASVYLPTFDIKIN